MDFEKKKRNITYTSDSCKMYLRHDFKHRCAYCGAIEEALSPIVDVADKLFEKDHFHPKSIHYPDSNNYSNLVYSCCKCNGKKSNILLPLNPCVDDIFSGCNPHIIGGTEEFDYIFIATTRKGEQFIADLELNSKYYRRLRKNQQHWLQSRKKGMDLLDDPNFKEKISSENLVKIKNIIYYGVTENIFETICGGSDHALKVIEAFNYLKDKGYRPNPIFEGSEIDLIAVIDEKEYCGTIRIEPSISTRKIKTSILAERKNYGLPYGLFVFVPNQCAMCFYKVDFEKVNWEKTQHSLTECILL